MIRAEVRPSRVHRRPTVLRFRVGKASNLTLRLFREHAELRGHVGDPDGAQPRRFPLREPISTPVPIELIRDDRRMALCIDGSTVGRWFVADRQLGEPVIAEGELALGDLYTQRVADIAFGDDFSREADVPDPWHRSGGDWRIDRIARAGSSVNAFRFRSDGRRDAFATAGHWFWHDYGVRAALQPGMDSKGAGIVACSRDGGNGVLFRWLRTGATDAAHHAAEGELQLVVMRKGEESILERRGGMLDPDRWYELALIVHDDDVYAFVDGTRLFARRIPELSPGEAGLWSRDASAALFDDVMIRGFVPGAIDPARSGPVLMTEVFGPRKAIIPQRMATDRFMQSWSLAAALELPTPGMRVQDYTFYSAPIDWRRASGYWEITSRWICRPEWSWFGGVSHQAATVWCKKQIFGDQVIDLHAAVMMSYGVQREGLPSGYRRRGDLNLSICGDGQTLSSGYTLMFGGFDNTRTCLWRGNRIVAERADRLYPSAKTRKLHNSWFNLRMVKAGGVVRALLDGEEILVYEDPQPLAGGHAAVWTWDAGIMIPRVRIAGETFVLPASPFLPADVRPSPTGDDECAALRRIGRDGSLVFANPQSGGNLSAKLPVSPFDARRSGVLSFGYRLPPEFKGHLYLEANGHDFYVSMTGPETVGEHVRRETERVVGRPVDRAGLTGVWRRPTRLGVGAAIADGRWHRFRMDLSTPLSQFFPRHERIDVACISLGNWCNERYLMCGFGGNPKGMRWELRDVRLGPAPAAVRTAVSAPPAERGEVRALTGAVQGGTRPVPLSEAGWRPADDSPPVRMGVEETESGAPCLWIAAGAHGFKSVLVERLLDPLKLTALGFELRGNMWVDAKIAVRAGGAWQTLPLTPWPAWDDAWHTVTVDLAGLIEQRRIVTPIVSAVAIVGPPRDAPDEATLRLRGLRLTTAAFPGDKTAPTASEHSPAPGSTSVPTVVRVRLRDERSGIDAASIRVSVGDESLDLRHPGVRFDPATGRLECVPTMPEDGSTVACRVAAADRAGNALRGGGWSWTVDYSLDTTPPPAPYVACIPGNRLQWDHFEDDRHMWHSRRGGHGQRTQQTAATGSFSYEAEGFSTFARYVPFEAARYPKVSFDYRLRPGATFNWVLRVDDRNWEVRCNSLENKADVLAELPGIVADDRWHRASFDLLDLLAPVTRDPATLIIEHIATYNRGSRGRWFDNLVIAGREQRAPEVEWSEPADATGIRGYSVAVDRKPDGPADTRIDTTDPRIVFGDLEPGTWHVHVRACDGAGNWGPAGHARFEVTR